MSGLENALLRGPQATMEGTAKGTGSVRKDQEGTQDQLQTHGIVLQRPPLPPRPPHTALAQLCGGTGDTHTRTHALSFTNVTLLRDRLLQCPLKHYLKILRKSFLQKVMALLIQRKLD